MIRRRQGLGLSSSPGEEGRVLGDSEQTGVSNPLLLVEPSLSERRGTRGRRGQQGSPHRRFDQSQLVLATHKSSTSLHDTIGFLSLAPVNAVCELSTTYTD